MFFFNLKLQNAISPVMKEFMLFHDITLIMVLFMIVIILGTTWSLIYSNYKKLNFIDFSELEIFWTMLPGMILLMLSLPSLKLLYYLDLSKKKTPNFNIKILGHQWYWSYGLLKVEDTNFDSYMLNLNSCEMGDLRLLEVDLPLFVPCMEFIRLLVSSSDVIHSFSVNSLGMKIDAVPGRLNFGYFYSSMLGSFYGQCSEICGVNHSFMPMKVEMMNL